MKRQHHEHEGRHVQELPAGAEPPPGVLELARALENFTARSEMAPNWSAQNYQLKAGIPCQLAGTNPQRRRLIVYTDAANTQPVWISPGQLSAVPAGGRAGAVQLPAPDGAPLEQKHAGPVYAISSADAVVYVIEEYHR